MLFRHHAKDYSVMPSSLRPSTRATILASSTGSTQQQQLTIAPPFLEEVSGPADGSFFVFASNHAGYSHLFLVNRNSANLRQLTSGESREIESDCSPDGHWIVYASKSSLPGEIALFKLWKILAERGTHLRLMDHEAYTPHFSPDGQWISYVCADAKAGCMVIIPAEGDAPAKTFETPTRQN